MKTNNKVKLMDLAIDIIAETNVDDLETVDVSETEYDDGSIGVSINLTYPSEKKDKAPLSTVVKIDGKEIAKEISNFMK